ncbi:tetratricopeptide repeat protein [Candidatus Poribacteria bacterium]|nr:tetratricopeptide repeat protein [Candidatus Poribacteria bacterium]MYK19146.1 tetratricopeptide repeat protein [Candidatus Poribacteria bacterium]
MRYLNILIILVLMTCFIFGHNLQAQNKEVSPSSIDSIVLNSEMVGVFETPELVAPTDANTELNTEMRDAANFYATVMWAIYNGTSERNVRESKAAYDVLIEEFGLDGESPAPSVEFVSSHDLSFIYTERATLQFNILQNIPGAGDDVRKAIALNPESVPATWLLAQILTRRVFASIQENRRDTRTQALQEEMLAVLKQVIELDPDHHRAHYYLGTMARDLGEIETAITSFKALTRIMPFDDQFHTELGELYEMQNRLEEALLSYERVVTILPEQLSARNRLGQLYLQTGDYPAAIKTFLAILTRLEAQTAEPRTANREPRTANTSETEIEAHYGIGLAYQEQNDLEKSEFHIMRAISLLEARAASMRGGTRRVRSADRVTLTMRLQEMRHALGQIYLRFNVPRKAINIFAKILETDANYVPALSGIGMAYQMLDDLKRAEDYLRKAIELSSKSELPDAYNALGYLYAEQGIKLDEAAALVRRALKSSPTSGAYLDSLGFIYFKQGKLDAAIENLELAIRYLPDTPEILLHLADAYLQKGLKEKALQTLEQAVRLEPDNAELRQKLDAVKASR